jgi:hypothetical protein
MTLRELACAIDAVVGHTGAALERGDLALLMNKFPDR